jgi:hypothetical protein
VRDAVKTRLGYDPFFFYAPETLFAEVTRVGDSFQVDIKLVDADARERGARRIAMRGGDCGAIVQAMALTISLVIDPASVMGPSPPSAPPSAESSSPPPNDAPPATTEAPPVPVPLPPPPAPGTASDDVASAGRARPPASIPVISTHAVIGVLGAFGMAPSATAGATLAFGMQWRALSIDVEGRANLPVSGPAKVPPARVRAWLAAGAIAPCVHLGVAFACPLAVAGVQDVVAEDIAAPQRKSGFWWALGGRAGVEVPLWRAAFLRADGELLRVVTPIRLTIDAKPAYSFPSWSGTVDLGLGWRFF